MAWLVADGRVLASAEVAATFSSRLRGLIGRSGVDGVLVLEPARSVHTLGMRFPIDVAFCDANRCVVRIVTVKPWRMTRPVMKARTVIEAEAGAFDRWGVRCGDALEVRT